MENPNDELNDILPSLYSIDLKEKINKLRGGLKGGIDKIRTFLEPREDIDWEEVKGFLKDFHINLIPSVMGYRHYKKYGDLKDALIVEGARDTVPILGIAAVSCFVEPPTLPYVVASWFLLNYTTTMFFISDYRHRKSKNEQ